MLVAASSVVHWIVAWAVLGSVVVASSGSTVSAVMPTATGPLRICGGSRSGPFGVLKLPDLGADTLLAGSVEITS